jgi:hypothetical protein
VIYILLCNVIRGVLLDMKPTFVRFVTREDGVVIPAGEGVSRPSGEEFRNVLCVT